MEQILQLFDKQTRQTEANERQLFEKEIPIYLAWERILDERYKKFSTWSKPCSSRELEEECVGTSSKNSRVDKSAIKCSWRRNWFSQSRCVSDSEQRDVAIQQLLAFIDNNNPSKHNIPILPFTGFISDLIFELTNSNFKILNAETVFSHNTVDYEAVIFYFLWNLSRTTKYNTPSLVRDLLTNQPEKLSLIIDIIAHGEMSLKRRFECINELLAMKNVVITTRKKKNVVSINWSVFLFPLLVFANLPSTEAVSGTNNSYLQLVKTSDEVVETKNFYQQVNNQFKTWYGSLDAPKLAKVLTDLLDQQEHVRNQQMKIIEHFDNNLKLFVPKDNLAFKQRLATISTYGTKIIRYVSLIQTYNDYQVAEQIWLSNVLTDVVVPEMIRHKIAEIGNELDSQVTPALLSDSDTFQSIVQIVSQPYNPSILHSSEQTFMIDKLKKMLAIEMKTRQVPSEELKDAAIFLECVEDAVEVIEEEKSTKQSSHSIDRSLVNFRPSHINELIKYLDKQYQIKTNAEEIGVYLEQVADAFKQKWSRDLLTLYTNVIHDLENQLDLSKQALQYEELLRNNTISINILMQFYQPIISALVIITITSMILSKSVSFLRSKKSILTERTNPPVITPVTTSSSVSDLQVNRIVTTNNGEIGQIVNIKEGIYIVQILTPKDNRRKMTGGKFVERNLFKSDLTLIPESTELLIFERLRAYDNKIRLER